MRLKEISKTVRKVSNQFEFEQQSSSSPSFADNSCPPRTQPCPQG
jgi:hypothetical protein